VVHAGRRNYRDVAGVAEIAAVRIAVIVLMERRLGNRLGDADGKKQQNDKELCKSSVRAAGSYLQ
jgi:hypothetical protein